MKSYPVEKTRHLVLRAGPGDSLPGDLARALLDEAVACGWVRASGVLADVELRAFDGALGGLAEPRRITGPVQALSIEGSVGLERGSPTVALRAVLARETDRGMEVLAGEIAGARVVALEVFVTSFDDLALARTLDRHANVVLLGEASDAPPPAPTRPATIAAWADAARSSAGSEPPPRAEPSSPEVARPAAAAATANRGALGGAIPARPVRPQAAYEEALVPQEGDTVEHFAFGPMEVVKSDGDRLHLRAGKEGRVREIALEMLKVTALESEGPNRRYKLERKL